MIRANPFRYVGTLAQCGPRPDDAAALERRRALAEYAPRSIINAGARFYRVPGLKPGPVPIDSRHRELGSMAGGASNSKGVNES